MLFPAYFLSILKRNSVVECNAYNKFCQKAFTFFLTSKSPRNTSSVVRPSTEGRKLKLKLKKERPSFPVEMLCLKPMPEEELCC